MAISANHADDRAEQMITLTRRLTGLLQRETELFRARTPQLASELAEEKGQLARIYRAETLRISRDPSLLQGLNAGLKDDLRATTKAFNQALEANRAATDAVRQITEGIVQSLAKEVAANRAAPNGYGALGQAGTPASSNMSAITLNKQV